MTDSRLILSIVFGVAASIHGGPSMAQTDPMRLAHVSMANQMGVIEYCMGKGWTDQAAVDAEKQAAARLPATSDQTGLAEAEATGRKGELMNNGTTLSLASMAQKGNTTEQDLCSRMASSAKTVAAQQSPMPGMPAGTTMPTLPSGMTMPSMPSGMAMPSMPGMPGMPGMPKTN